MGLVVVVSRSLSLTGDQLPPTSGACPSPDTTLSTWKGVGGRSGGRELAVCCVMFVGSVVGESGGVGAMCTGDNGRCVEHDAIVFSV